ncbi:hypothetical protein RYX36_034016 [Vicia faba]
MLEIDVDEWYTKDLAFTPNLDTVLLNTVDSYLLPQNHKLVNTLSSLLNNPFEIPSKFGFLEPQGSALPLSSKMGGLVDFTAIEMMSFPHFPQTSDGFMWFQNSEEGSGKMLFLNKSKVLRRLDLLPPSGTQPTLF